jgi:TonB family protein
LKIRHFLAWMGLALLLEGSVVLSSNASAQGSAADGSKRKVVSKVDPVYPPIAKQIHLVGRVKIEVTIAADGHVVDTHVIGGSPLLVNASQDALKKWRFEPGPRETTESYEFAFGESE